MSKAGNLFVVIVCLLTAIVVPRDAFAVSGETFRQWGADLMAQIEADFSRSDGLYQTTTSNSYSDYAWGQGVMSNALAAAAKVDPSYLARARKQADEFHARYWCTHDGTSGYNASYGNCGDRYYDDNAWIALSLLELYELTGDEKYLTWARETVVFCMTGENGPGDDPDGGIRWHESNTSGASVCASAPTTLANLLIYQFTGIESYLTDGSRLYHWLMNSDLRYSSGIFHETNQGPLGYQTAVMTQTAVRLYQLTGDGSYLQDAQLMAAAMEHEFISRDTHKLNQTGKWGGHDMTNAYVDLYEVDHNRHWLNIAAGYLEYLQTYCWDASTGLYPTSWNNTSGSPSDGLIDNASVARAFWKMASTPGGSAPVYMNIKHRSSNRCMRLFDSQTADNTNIVLYDQYSDYTSERFTLTDLGNGYFSIRSWKSDTSIKPYENGAVNNTNAVIYSADIMQYSQQWALIDLGNGYYNIKNRLSGKSLQPRNSGTVNNTVVVTNTTNLSLSSQQWLFDGYNPPTSVTPYASVNNGLWEQTDWVAAQSGDRVTLKGQASGSGTWHWSGPNGFSASGSEMTISDIRPHQAGNYIATFTNSAGVESYSAVKVSVPSVATLYQHCPWHGWEAKLGVGAYTAADLVAAGALNNDASSFKMAPGYIMTIYDYDNFQGPSRVLSGDNECLTDEGWNDRITSVIIEGTPGILGYWKFNDAGDLYAEDSSGNNLHGTLTNMSQDHWVLGKQCSGLEFDGIDDYVEIVDFKGPANRTGRTCTAWIKTTHPGGEIMTWGSEDGKGARWIIRVNEVSQLRTEVQGGNIIGTTPINDGLWHHIAVVLQDDGSPDIDEVKMYVDGKLEAISSLVSEPIRTGSDLNVQIGVYDISKRHFQGLIDEVRIYDYPLDGSLIRSFYLDHVLVGDFDGDWNIDLADYATLAYHWQETDACEIDLTCDCIVDMDDVMILAGQWLEQVDID